MYCIYAGFSECIRSSYYVFIGSLTAARTYVTVRDQIQPPRVSMIEMGLYQSNPNLASLPDMGRRRVRRSGETGCCASVGAGKGVIISGGRAVLGVCPQILDEWKMSLQVWCRQSVQRRWAA